MSFIVSTGFYKKLVTVVPLLFITNSFFAQANINTHSDLRSTYKQAEKQLWKSESSRFQQLYKQLHFYPLQPYLDQRILMDKMRISKVKEISEFLTKYKGTPLDWPLRKRWLTYLAKRKRESLFLEFYQPTSDAELTCYYLRYQLKASATAAQIMPQVSKLWLVGKSQPKACDPLFKAWIKAGYLTQDKVWQRIALAADGGKHTLIPYLTTLLPKQEQHLAKLWHKVRRDPAYITKLTRFKNKSAKETQIITYGLKRLIWRSPSRALSTYKKSKDVFPFTEQQQQQITLKFALALASKNHPQAQVWLKQVDAAVIDSNVVQWRIANTLRANDWQATKDELESFPQSQQEKIQWRYWYGRTLVALGDNAGGEMILKDIAKQRHYYGFLAASYLELPFDFQDKPLQVSQQEKDILLANPAAKRAFEFFFLNRFHHARKEWNYWLTQLDDREKLVAAKIANEAGWYDRAIFTLSRVGYLDDVDLRFPLAFDEEITKYATNHKINPAWAFAITRRESSFMSDANSSAGAKGLMQVMPATAKQLIKRTVSQKYLLNSRNNINLGTKYLRKLLDRYDGNAVLATASYNAGPYRVSRWIKDIESLPADMWIETIPFKETRDYVKSVMAYQQIYQVKVGQSQSLFSEIVNMAISP